MSKSIFIYALLFIVTSLEAQVHIGPTAQAPDPSAVLELESGFNKGLLLPRMRKIDMLAISNPAEGLTVYLTDEHVSYVFNGTEWVKVHIDGDAFELPYAGTFDYNGAVLNLTNTHLLGTSILGKDTNNGTGIKGVSNTGNGVVGIAEFASGIGGLFANNNDGISLISDGKTGIGTSNPSNLLHVNGANTEGTTMIVEDDINPVIQLKHYGNNQGYLSVDGFDMVMATNVNNDVGNLVLRTNDVDRVIINDAGQVGIGEESTGALLHVDAMNSAATAMTMNDLNPTIQLQNEGVSKGLLQLNGDDIRLGTNFANTEGKVVFRTGGVDRMKVFNNGDVTIGTPYSDYHNAGLTVYQSSITIDDDFNAGTGPALRFQKSYPNNTVQALALIYASTDYIRHIATGRGYEFSDNTGDKWLRLNKTTGYANFQNRIAVNTDNPTANLHLNGVNDGATAMIVNDNDPIIQMQNSGSNKGYLQVDGNNMVLAANISNASGKVIIRTNDTDRFFVDNAGNVSIGGSPPPPGYKLSVKGQIAATDFDVVAAVDWPDYVFDPTYKLMTLEEIEEYININKHLPNIPKASILEKDGYSLPEMQKKMMEKIEELTLHLIEANKQIKELQQKVKP